MSDEVIHCNETKSKGDELCTNEIRNNAPSGTNDEPIWWILSGGGMSAKAELSIETRQSHRKSA
jgi:hypothetical protein